jgi:hypothetical protein
MREVAIPSGRRSEDGMGEGVKHERPNDLGEVDGVLDWIMSIIN